MNRWNDPRRGARVTLIVAAAALLGTGRASAQSVELVNDSLMVQLVNTDVRAAIRAIARFLDRPVMAGGLGEVRIEVFETPGPVPLEDVPDLLRGLVEASGLVFEVDSAFYRVSRPSQPTPGISRARAGGAPGPDQEVEPIQLHTTRLRHARAADVAATLNQLYGTGQGYARPAGLSTASLSNQLASDRTGAPSDPPQEVTPDEGGASLQSAVTIVPDELTNSLLIRSTEADFAVLQEGIAQLDVRPLQVLIEVVVVEARKDRQFELGFVAELPPTSFGGGTIEGVVDAGGGLGDLVIQVMGLGRGDVNGVLSAARQRGDVEILSRPVLLASNNTEATLLVGTQQPFVQVSRSLPTDTPQRDQVVQYRDVGTKLSVRPTINQDGYVALLIQQEISAATGETQFDAPVISSRETTTQVLVADQQTIVIGGLTDELQDEVRSGIPLLADIPLLGGLFGGTRIRTTETELFLFITPTIIASDEDLAQVTRERVPERIMEAQFMHVGPITVPEVNGCASGTPGCSR